MTDKIDRERSEAIRVGKYNLDDALAHHTAARWAFDSGYYNQASKFLNEAYKALDVTVRELEWPAKYRPYVKRR